MKKTISINISGSIFHIEEDGYDKLKNYLTSIQQYFSSYEDSQEIVTDIENRIAEKLTAKLKAAAVQAVTIDDVNQLIGAMGTVADFEAEEDIVGAPTTARQTTAKNTGPDGPQPTAGSAQLPPPAAAYNPQPASSQQPRVLRRDLRRKTIGGVASGLANYFNVDPVWIRLAFVVLVFGFPSITASIGHGDGPGPSGGLSGIAFLAYIAMWIAFPGSMTLEDDKSVKKFFRNPDDKVLGGVASGLAAYFGTDTAIIRLVFVLTIPVAGLGFLAYLVLWVISPTANTLTEKMEMQGQPITLSNIEQNIKSSLNEPLAAEEGGLTKLLLFPFRAISLIITGMGRVFGPLASGLGVVVRVFAGVIVLIVAFALMIVSLAVLGAAFGIATGAQFGGLPVELIRADLDVPLILAGFITLFMPAFWLALLGVWLITLRKNLISGRTAVTLIAVQGVAFLITALMAGQLANDFRKNATIEEVKNLPLTAQIPVFDLTDADTDYDFDPDIELKSYVGTGLKLVYFRQAKGGSRAEAETNARTIRYAITQRDSIFRFANEFDLTPNSRFRAQDLDIDVFVPVGKPFKLTSRFAYAVANHSGMFTGNEHDNMEARIWQFAANGDLICLNFPRKTQEESDDDKANENAADNTDTTAVNLTMNTNELLGDDFDRKGPRSKTFSLDDFTDIETSGAFIVRIKRGAVFSVVADGEDEGLDNLTVKVDGNTLKAYRGRNGVFNWTDNERVGITITMPDIDGLDLSGACRARITGFRNLDDLAVDLSGASKAALSVDGVNELNVSLSGAAKVELAGRAANFQADLSGASRLDATQMRVDNAEVDASGAGRVEMGKVSGNYNVETSGAGNVTRE